MTPTISRGAGRRNGNCVTWREIPGPSSPWPGLPTHDGKEKKKDHPTTNFIPHLTKESHPPGTRRGGGKNSKSGLRGCESFVGLSNKVDNKRNRKGGRLEKGWAKLPGIKKVLFVGSKSTDE